MIKLKDILNEVISEMGMMTIQPILDLYDQNPELVSKAVFPHHKLMSKEDVQEELLGMEYEDFDLLRKELDINPLEEACWDGYQQQGMKKKGNKKVPNLNIFS